MRKHSVRKWIHAICDLLPLLVIPIFALAVRSDNNFQPIEVNYGGGYEVTDKYETNEIETLNDFEVNHLYKFTGNINFYTDINFDINIVKGQIDDYSIVDTGYDYDFSDFVANNTLYKVTSGLNSNLITIVSDNTYIIYEFDTLYFSDIYFYIDYDLTLNNFKYFLSYEGYDISDFSASDFNVKQVNYIEGVIYNDTDVGSQMMYTLYQTTDKYFNFNNVGVFQDLYDWFETNMFHGTAPMSFYIVWNVILFEFIMDLIFLTYMVFMFIIDFTECMIDRFFEKSYRGGR